jgi:hypothetical protein
MAAITILDTVPSAVPTPASGKTSLFIDSDVMKVKTSTGSVITVGGGSVSSVEVSGGTTGLTFTGGPITSSGTITMGGALGTAYGGVPTGGTTGQVLAKTGSGDYSVAWTTPAAGGVTSFNTRTGDITLTSGDVTGALTYTPAHNGANSDITSLTGITGLITTPTGIAFNTTTPAAPAVGQLNWNTTDGTLEVGLIGGNAVLQIGQEQVIRVLNNTGSTLQNGKVVYITGAQGNRPTAAYAQANSEVTSESIIGVLTEDILNNQEGFATTNGIVHDIDTSTFTDGAMIYLSSTVPGGITATEPTAPDHRVVLGYVIRAHATVGQIFVAIDTGLELAELHDVDITTPSTGQVLTYQTNVWKNHTPYTASASAPINPNPGDTWTNTDTGITYEYFTDGDGSQWVQWNGTSLPSALEVTSINDSGYLILPKTSGYGIKVDNTTPTFGWNDLLGPINIRGTGANDPAWNVFRTNIRAYQFSVNDEVWITYHMPHDWVPGTDMYLHTHWAHNSATVTSGAVTFGADITFAKGFNQQAFPATKNITWSQTASTTQYQHMVAETQITVAGGSATQLDTNTLEVDGLILVRLYVSANTVNGTPEPFIFTSDIHYQSSGIATKNRSPSFYA